jgi:hypothetical protein
LNKSISSNKFPNKDIKEIKIYGELIISSFVNKTLNPLNKHNEKSMVRKY